MIRAICVRYSFSLPKQGKATGGRALLGMGIGEGLSFSFSLHFILFSYLFPAGSRLDLCQILGKNLKNLSKNLFVSYIYSTFAHLIIIIDSSF